MTHAVVPFMAWHGAALIPALQPMQAHVGAELTPEVLAALEGEESFTLTGDGWPVAAGGVYRHGSGWLAWALLSRDMRGGMVAATRSVLRVLRGKGHVWALVQVGWPQAEAWAAMLGFRPLGGLLPEIHGGAAHRVWGAAWPTR